MKTEILETFFEILKSYENFEILSFKKKYFRILKFFEIFEIF